MRFSCGEHSRPSAECAECSNITFLYNRDNRPGRNGRPAAGPRAAGWHSDPARAALWARFNKLGKELCSP